MRPSFVNRRIDPNQGPIVKSLRQIPGVTAEIGHDDILVGYRGRTFWFEVKRDDKAPSQPGQQRLERAWQGHYRVVWKIEQILEDIGINA